MTESWIQVTIIFIGLIASVVRYEHRMTRLETKLDALTGGNGISNKISTVETKLASCDARLQAHIGVYDDH